MNVYEILQVGEGVTLSIYRLDIISCSLKSVFKFEKWRTVVVREEFQFSDLRCFRNTALDCFLSRGSWKLFTARRDNPICSCSILFLSRFYSSSIVLRHRQKRFRSIDPHCVRATSSL